LIAQKREIPMANVIRIDGDLANYNAQLVTSVASELPPQSSVSQVDGPSQGATAADLMRHLRTRAQQLAVEVGRVQKYVQDNAQALSSAVTTLRERDELSASEAAQTTSLIETAATTPPVPGSAGAAGGAAGVRGALPGVPQ
jgi:hypothetical protein